MTERYCPNCGTEVDEDARFCPTCGQLLDETAATRELPPAPAWPEREPEPADVTEAEADEEPEPQGPQGVADVQLTLPPEADEPQADQPDAEEPAAAAAATRPIERQVPPAGDPPPPPPPPAPRSSALTGDLPVTWPTLLSGWLIGAGALLGAIALLASLTDPVSLLLFLALLGVAATVFLAERMPAIPRLRLVVFAICLVGLGIALERAGFRAGGADSVLLVAMIAAAGGALLIELDRDRPVPPPAR